MTTKRAYQLLIVTEQCLKQRATCNHDCEGCPYFCSQKELQESLCFLKDILKARDPTLYFGDELTQLKEVLSNYANQSKETKPLE